MTEVTEKKKVKQKIKPPKNYFVVFKNDDYTPMEFVVYLLRSIFHKTESEAEKIISTTNPRRIRKRQAILF